MGRKSVVVAVLLEHSVNVQTSRQSSREMAKGGTLLRGARLSPSHKDSPDTYTAKTCPSLLLQHFSCLKNNVKTIRPGIPRMFTPVSLNIFCKCYVKKLAHEPKRAFRAMCTPVCHTYCKANQSNMLTMQVVQGLKIRCFDECATILLVVKTVKSTTNNPQPPAHLKTYTCAHTSILCTSGKFQSCRFSRQNVECSVFIPHFHQPRQIHPLAAGRYSRAYAHAPPSSSAEQGELCASPLSVSRCSLWLKTRHSLSFSSPVSGVYLAIKLGIVYNSLSVSPK